MSKLVVNGAMLKCSMGMTPGTLTVLPASMIEGDAQPVATVMDFAPATNIAPFGMCHSPANPQVAAATSAAMGVLTPQPCMPMTVAPWVPGSPTVTLHVFAALTDDSKCMCMWAGTIEVVQPGATQFTVD